MADVPRRYDWEGLLTILLFCASAAIPVIGFALGYDAVGVGTAGAFIVIALAAIIADLWHRWRGRARRSAGGNPPPAR